MAKFYATIQGARGEATRLGHKSIRASAQSWQGSIVANLYEHDGEIMYEIRTGKGSTAYGHRTISSGKLADLLRDGLEPSTAPVESMHAAQPPSA